MHHRNVVRRGLEKAITDAGLPHLTWHDLRHIAASALIPEGASVAYLSRVLGHASPAITLSLYAHEFARAEHADHRPERMEAAFGALL
jgi:integrase